MVIVALMTGGLFGGILYVRAATIIPLRAGLWVWTVFDPIPNVVSGEMRPLYVLVEPTVDYGTAPYIIEVKINTQVFAHYTQQYGYSSNQAPVLWSCHASCPAQLTVVVSASDNSTSPQFATAFTTITLPT